MLNFTLSELIHSDTAAKHKINNMPDIHSLDNLLNLIVYCLQPIRDKLGKPIRISSGYRNPTLNSLVNGAKNSQHLFGQAADLNVAGMSVRALVEFIYKSGVEYDQLINEYDQWVHVSFVKGRNRKQPPFKIG